ncbi:transporter substrate-binding domain-containing protein [Salidesulfovibrio onnuriiensis]|uniref:transporter substrate-binding domain-containing protein n=1 Tax=Salidesulfovibrio onnuriiensis TaxID=2583823 RepID=UPI0011CA3A06|nr:transporter substrate-binding domain-containing protein [Salidesulfovibrio onnuriiensis]
MRSTTFVLSFFLILATAHAAWAQTQLRVATEGDYPPFNYMQNGQPAGFDVDIAMALCKAMDAECTIQTVEWAKIIDGLVDGQYDLIVASMARTDERDKLVDFTTPYYRSRTNFIGDPEKLSGISKQQLEGKTLAAMQDTVQAEYLRNNLADVATIKLYSILGEAYADLTSDKIDALLIDSLVAYEFLKSEQGRRFDYIGAPLETSDPSSKACIAVREGDTELREALEEALNQIRLDGTYERINRAYFPFSVY